MVTNKKIIFIVDDDQMNLTEAQDALAEVYDLFAIESSARLSEALETFVPDLIIISVEMQGIDLFDFVSMLRFAPKTQYTPIVFTTTKSDCENLSKSLSLGDTDYIVRPFMPQMLKKRAEIHIMISSQRQKILDFTKNAQKIVDEKTKAVWELQNAIIKVMSDLVDARDSITGGHIERTQLYLGELLNAAITHGVYEEEIYSWDIIFILPSAQLHDVGKINIKDSILQKDGKFTDDEFEEIKMHTILGEEVIEKIAKSTTDRKFLEHAKIFASTHHEKWDGTGYPKGLKGTDIPLQGRLLAIADVYDALVSSRPYKKAFTHAEAVRIITEGRGKHFDPVLVDLFLKVSDEFERISALYRIT